MHSAHIMAAEPTQSRPVSAYLALLILGFLPPLGVGLFYDDLPNRLVVQWDGLGQLTVIGTRASSVMTIAVASAVIGVIAVLLAALFNNALSSSRMRSLFLGLNAAQIVTIGLTCLALVSEALGYGVAARAAVPPAASVLLFACALMFWRASSNVRETNGAAATVFTLGACMFLTAAVAVFFAGLYFTPSPLGIAASVLATIGMAMLIASDRKV